MAKQKQVKQSTGGSVRQGNILASVLQLRTAALIVFAFSFILYFNSIFNQYNLDDELVTQNHRLTSQGISSIPDIFTSAYYEDKAGNKYEYRPVVLTTFAIEHTIVENPHVSHAINVLLYAVTCVLLFYLLAGLFKNYNILLPLIITLVFAAHPIHTEVVASIKNRDEILALLFGLLTLWAALRFTEGRGWVYLFLIPFFFTAGLLSKTTTIMFSVIIPLTLIMLTDARFGRLIVITAIMLVPAILFARLYSLIQQILFGLALPAGVALLYVIVHAKNVWAGVTGAIVALRRRVDKQDEALPGNQPADGLSLDFSFLKKPLLSIGLFTSLIALVVAGVAGIIAHNVWLACVPLLVLVTAYAFTRRELQFILVFPIAIISLFALVSFNIRASVFEALFVLFIAIQLISPDKRFRVLGFLLLVAHFALVSVPMDSRVLVTILMFAVFIDKRMRWVSLAVVALLTVSWLGYGYKIVRGANPLNAAYFSFPLLFGAAFLILKGKKQLVNRIGAISIPVALSVLFFFGSYKDYYKTVMNARDTYFEVVRTKAADPSPEQSGRPLRYIEYPLQQNEKPSVKLGTAMVVLGKYFKMVFVPYPMSFYYGYSYITATDFFTAIPIAVFVLHAVLFVIALVFIRRQRLLSYAILLYLITIAAYSGLVTPIPGMLGDRFLLVPSLGFAFFIAWLLIVVFKQKFEDKSLAIQQLAKPLKISLVVILSLYSIVTIARNTQWKDRVTLFSRDIKTVDNSTQAQNLLGLHLFIASNSEPDFNKQLEMRLQAAEHFRRSLEIYPEFLNASYDRGRTFEAIAATFASRGDKARAAEFYDKAYVQYEQTLRIDSNFVSPCYSMAIISQNRGDLPNAIRLYEKYLTRHPRQKEIYSNLSYCYFLLKDYNNSIAVNHRAIKNLPGAYEPVVNIGKTYLEMGQQDSAYFYLEKCHRMKPYDLGLVKVLLQISVQRNDKQKIFYYNSLLHR